MADSFPRQQARTRRFTLGTPRLFQVTPAGVYFCRSSSGTDSVNRLWMVDLATGHERVVIDPAQLATGSDADLPAAERARRERAREASGGVVAYATNASGTVVATALGGSLVVADTAAGTVRVLDSADAVFDPRPDPEGNRIAYVSGDELRLIDIASGADRALCSESAATVSWGSAEFVAAEEMGRSRGHWWSPDGGHLLVARVDVDPVPVWWIADPARPATDPVALRYPAAGAPNADVQLFVIDAADGSLTEVEWDRAAYEYLADAGWRAGAGPVVPWVLVQSRSQRDVVLLDVDPADGGTVERRHITDEIWVELVPGSPAFVGESIITVEPHGAANRLCIDGAPTTDDDLQVRAICGVDGTEVWFSASTDPTAVELWSIDVEDTVVRRRSADPEAVHSAVVGTGAAVVNQSTLTHNGPTATVIRGDVPVAMLASYADVPLVDARPQMLELGDRGLRGALLLPPDADPDAPLPVLLDPYGGPHAQRVVRSRLAHAGAQWFAEQGFAVLVVDGRGTPGRGPAWERAVHLDLAEPVLDDQIDGLHAAAEIEPRLDLTRVGIRGWSFGGYLSALAVIRRPDVFHAAVAGAPVTDWALYDTHYTERYLGRPQDEPEAYRRSSIVEEASALERPLMIIHGLADDNVVVAHSLALSGALLAAGRPHQVLPLSGVTHMASQEAVAENLLLLQARFLREVLGSGPASLA